MRGKNILPIILAAALVAGATSCKGKSMLFDNAVGVRAPEFPTYPADRWINAEPRTMESLRGRIVVIDFWEYTCVNCIRTLPYVTEWHRRYADHGVVIIGVHTPEFAFGRDRANVARAVEEFGIEYPVVLDNDYEIWSLYANRYWPRKYIVDREGKIVYDHAGEGGYAETEGFLQRLILENDPDAELPPTMAPVRPSDEVGARCYPRTPELYCGYGRGRYGNDDKIGRDETKQYNDGRAGGHARNLLYLHGEWRVGEEQATSEGPASGDNYMLLQFQGNEINAVMSPPPGEEVRVYLEKDGRPLAEDEAGADVAFDERGSYVAAAVGRMYQLYDAEEYGSAEFSLHPAGPGVSIFAFTFGSCVAE
jgi:thiol-disulfide isomerase/thioredoxin